MQPLSTTLSEITIPSAAPRQRTARVLNAVGEIDVWPAAGGGLLVSLTLPALRASPRMRSNLAGFFLKICPREAHALTIPYISLDAEGRRWLIDLVCDELCLPLGSISLAERTSARSLNSGALFQLEWCFRAAASAAKDLLLAEAAYIWDTDQRRCALRDGKVIHTVENLSASIGDFAAGAALRPLAGATQLRCGRRFGLTPKRARRPGFSALKDAWLGARILDG
jgi:hypothetical protein